MTLLLLIALIYEFQVGVAFLLALEHANGLKVSALENIELDRLFFTF